jgi:hypothetical protein
VVLGRRRGEASLPHLSLEKHMTEYIGARLLAFDGDDEANEQRTEVEIVENSVLGMIELAFDDRNERVYLKFKLEHLIAAVMQTRQTEE